MGNIFWRHARFSTNNQNHKITVTSTSISSNSKHEFASYGEHNPSHVQQHALLSQLYHNFISFTYFFPSNETCSINVNSLFQAAIKNLHVKANGIFVFLLLHPPLLTTTISEGITHARKNTFLRPKTITNISLAKVSASMCWISISWTSDVLLVWDSVILVISLLIFRISFLVDVTCLSMRCFQNFLHHLDTDIRKITKNNLNVFT